MSNPHDALFKAAFSQTEHAAGLLRFLMPAPMASRIDWSSLRQIPGSVVDPQLSERHADLLFSAEVTGGRTVLFYLVEHQSEPDPRMPLRLYTYVDRVWQKWQENHARELRVPAVLPIVVHHGASGWTGPRSLGEMYELPAVARDALSPYLPELRFLLDDLGGISLEELERRPMTDFGRLVLLCLKRTRLSPDIVEEVRRWLEMIARVLRQRRGRRAIGTLVRYILAVSGVQPRRLLAVLQDAFGRAGREAYMTGADMLRAETQADILVRLLTQRFGAIDAATLTRIRSASSEQLDRLLDRVLTATSLADLLADLG